MDKMRYRKEDRFILPLLFVSFFLMGHQSEAVIFSTSLTSKSLSVGDRIGYSVKMIVPKNATVTPPTPETDFGSIQVKEWNLYTTERDHSDSLSYDYLITTYIPEPCTIPELHFIIQTEESTDTVTTEAQPLNVISVITSDSADIMGLKSPLSAGKAPKWWLWILGITTGLGVLAFGGTCLFKKLRREPPPPPPVPPYEEAIDALNALGVKKYLQRGLIREYVFELSEIFKRYIGRRFMCSASDFTTEEMIAWSGAADLPKALKTPIDWFFRATDPVKFARLIPDSDTIERFTTEVRDFLEATRPTEQPDETSVNKQSTDDGKGA
jgi:hypothetical protein